MLNGNTFFALLLHHWRRTRWWLILPLLVSAAYATVIGIEIAHSRSLGAAWDAFQFSLIAKVVILVAGTLGFVVAMGAGEANAAFPRYAHALPIKDRHWSFSYSLYSLVALSLLAGFITGIDSYIWNRAVATEKVRTATAAELVREALIQKARTRQVTPPVAREPQKNQNPFRALRNRIPANAGIRQAPVSFTRHPWNNYGSWNELLFLVSVAFFCQSLFVALTLIQRVPVRAFATAVTLVATPLAAFAVDFWITYHVRSGPLWLFFRLFWPFAVVLAGSVVIHLSVDRERHGGNTLQRVAELLARPSRAAQRGFATTGRALAWYDWMTFGRYLVYGAIGVALPLAAAGVVADSADATGVLFLPTCGIAGIYIAYRLYHGDRQDHDAYLVTLPVTVERLSKSRMANMGKFIAAGVVATLLLELCVIVWDHTLSPELTWFTIFAPIIAWTLVWLAGPLFYPLIGGWLVAALIAALLHWLLLPRMQFEVIFACVAGGMVCTFLAAATVWLVRAARHRGLLFIWNKRLAIAAWIVAALFTVPMFLAESDGEGLPYVIILPMFLCLLPAAPFLALPLAIDRYRHR